MHGQPHEMFMSFFKTAGQATTRAMGTINMQGHTPIPIVPLQDQEQIKRLLHKIDQLLTKECILCGDLMLDMLNTSNIPEFDRVQAMDTI